MATSPYSSDIVLSKTDGSTNLVGLKLFRDAPNIPGGWKIDHVSPALFVSSLIIFKLLS